MRKLLGIALLYVMFIVGCAAKDTASMNLAAVPEACGYGIEQKVDTAAFSLGQTTGTEESTAPVAEAAAESVAYSDDPLVYVTFSQYADSFEAADGSSLFIYSCYKPWFMTGYDSTDLWLASAVDEAERQMQDSVNFMVELAQTDYQKQMASGEEVGSDFYSYSYYSNVNIQRMDSRLLSVLELSSTYSGEAHPNYSQTAYNMDIRNQEQLSLADVIYPEKAEELRDRLLDEIQKRLTNLEGSGLYSDYKETVTAYFADSELTPDWYFSDRGLVIYFNCYEIAPYAAGIIKIEFQYDTLVGVLKKAYFPEERLVGEGRAVLLDSTDGRVVLKPLSDGTYFYVGTEQETIYDVRLYRLSSWVTEDMPIVGQMLFAANRLTVGEAIQIAQSENAQMPEYLLTYSSGAGESFSMTVSVDEIREITMLIAE